MSADEQFSFAILGGRVLTQEGLVESDLAVEHGLISEGVPEEADLLIDVNGLLVAPGLIDLQINGGFGLDFTTDPDASVAIIADGIHLHPATVRLIRASKPAKRVVLITDAMAGMGAAPGEYVLGDLPSRWMIVRLVIEPVVWPEASSPQPGGSQFRRLHRVLQGGGAGGRLGQSGSGDRRVRARPD